MRKLFVTGFAFLLFFFYSVFLFCQTTEKSGSQNPKKLELNTGYYNLGSVDELYSYNLYSGGNICYGLKYYFGKRMARQQLSFMYAMVDREPGSLVLADNVVAEDDRERVLNSFLFEAVYSYQYPLNLFHSGLFHFYVTGDWMTTFNITTNDYDVPELIVSGLAPGALIEATLKRNRLMCRLSIPVIAWTLRNNYSLSMTQDYEELDNFLFIRQNDQLQFINTLFAVNAEIGYTCSVSKWFDIGCEYSFRYMYNSSPRELKSVTGIYTIGLTYKF